MTTNTDDSTARLQALRAKHGPYVSHGAVPGTCICAYCSFLEEGLAVPWPCDAALLGDVALAAAAVDDVWQDDFASRVTMGVELEEALDTLHAALAAVEEGRG